MASSYHAAFLTQLVGMRECCMCYAQIFTEKEAFALLTGTSWLHFLLVRSCPMKMQQKYDSETLLVPVKPYVQVLRKQKSFDGLLSVRKGLTT